MKKFGLEQAQKTLAAQPFSQHIGARIARIEQGECEVHIDLQSHHFQHAGIVHGGLLASIADISLAFAGGTMLQDAVTADLEINYVSPARGSKLIAIGTVRHSRKHTAWCEAKVYSDSIDPENISVIATGTIRNPRRRVTNETD